MQANERNQHRRIIKETRKRASHKPSRRNRRARSGWPMIGDETQTAYPIYTQRCSNTTAPHPSLVATPTPQPAHRAIARHATRCRCDAELLPSKPRIGHATRKSAVHALCSGSLLSPCSPTSRFGQRSADVDCRSPVSRRSAFGGRVAKPRALRAPAVEYAGAVSSQDETTRLGGSHDRVAQRAAPRMRLAKNAATRCLPSRGNPSAAPLPARRNARSPTRRRTSSPWFGAVRAPLPTRPASSASLACTAWSLARYRSRTSTRGSVEGREVVFQCGLRRRHGCPAGRVQRATPLSSPAHFGGTW